MSHEWRFHTDRDAANVPPWLLVAPGAQGAAHVVAVALTRIRQAQSWELSGEEGYITFHDLVELAQTDPATLSSVLSQLMDSNRVETDGNSRYRASTILVSEIEAAFRRRHPLADE